jgi:hypothetical protein
MKSVPRSRDIRVHLPERHGKRIIEMHARDGLHHPPVTQPEPAPVDRLHRSHVGGAELGDGNVLIALDRTGHAGRPQQLVTQVTVDELMQIEQVLQQLPAGRESRRHQLDQRLGIIRRDVNIGECRAQGPRVGGGCQRAIGTHAQRFLLDTLAATLQDLRLTVVDECGQSPLKGAIDSRPAHGAATLQLRPRTRRTYSEGLTLATMRDLPDILAGYASARHLGPERSTNQ